MAEIPELRRHAVEYMTWGYSGAITGAVEVSLDDGETWLATESVPENPKGFRILFAGSLAEAVAGATVLEPGVYKCVARVKETPEIIQREAGFIRALNDGY